MTMVEVSVGEGVHRLPLRIAASGLLTLFACVSATSFFAMSALF